MFLADGWRNAEPCRICNALGFQRADRLAQIVFGNRSHHEKRIGERPTIIPRVEIYNLRINRLNVWAAKQAGKNITKGVHTGGLYPSTANNPTSANYRIAVSHPIPANRMGVVVAVKEALGFDKPRRRPGSQLCLQCSTLGIVHCPRC